MLQFQQQLDMITAKVAKQFHVQTLCVGVYQKGETFFSCQGKTKYGKADHQTIFPIGSASKAFIATAALQLCHAGKLTLDDPVTKYLPTFKMGTPERTEELTMRDALCHRSGLPRHDITLFTNQDTPLWKMVDQIQYLEPAFPPRTRFCYQNHMFGLVSRMVEEASGLYWGDYVAQNIFNPLGMLRSYTRSQAYELSNTNYVLPKVGFGPFNIPTKNTKCDYVGGAGSISSCVEDMLHWAQVNLYEGQYNSEKIFEKKAVDELHQAQMPIRPGEISSYTMDEITDTSYGLGWFIENFRGKKYVHHGGTITGFKSAVGFMPSEDIAFCILSNRNNTQATLALEYTLCDWAMGIEGGNWNQKFLTIENNKIKEAKKKYSSLLKTKEKSPLERGLEGLYEHPTYGTLKILPKGKGYEVKFADFTLTISPDTSGHCIMYSPLLSIAFPCRFGKDEKDQFCLWAKLEESIEEYICFTKSME